MFDAEIIDAIKRNYKTPEDVGNFIASAVKVLSYKRENGDYEKLRSAALYRLVNAWQTLIQQEPTFRSTPEATASITGDAFRALRQDEKVKAAARWIGVPWDDVATLINDANLNIKGTDALLIGHRFKRYWPQHPRLREKLYSTLRSDEHRLLALIHWGYNKQEFEIGLKQLFQKSHLSLSYALFSLEELDAERRQIFWRLFGDRRLGTQTFRRAALFWINHGGTPQEILSLFPDLRKQDHSLYALLQAKGALMQNDPLLAVSWLKDVKDDEDLYQFVSFHFTALAEGIGKIGDARLQKMAAKAAKSAPYAAEEAGSVTAKSEVVPDRDFVGAQSFSWVNRLFRGTPLRRPLLSLLNARRFFMDTMKRYETDRLAREAHFQKMVSSMLIGDVKGRAILSLLKEASLDRKRRNDLLASAPPWVVAAAGALGYIPQQDLRQWYEHLSARSPVFKTFALLTWQGRVPFLPPISLYISEFGKEISGMINPSRWMEAPRNTDEIFRLGGARFFFFTAAYILSPVNWALGVARVSRGLVRHISRRVEDFKRFRAAYKAAKLQDAIMRLGPAVEQMVAQPARQKEETALINAQIQIP